MTRTNKVLKVSISVLITPNKILNTNSEKNIYNYPLSFTVNNTRQLITHYDFFLWKTHTNTNNKNCILVIDWFI